MIFVESTPQLLNVISASSRHAGVEEREKARESEWERDRAKERERERARERE